MPSEGGLPAAEGRGDSGASRVWGSCSISAHLFDLHPQLVSLVLGKEFVNAHYLHRGIDVADAQVADRSRHVEDEFAYPAGRGQGLGGHQDFTREQAVQEMVLE